MQTAPEAHHTIERYGRSSSSWLEPTPRSVQTVSSRASLRSEVDPPRKPPRPTNLPPIRPKGHSIHDDDRTPDIPIQWDPPKTRSRAPSFSELIDAVTSSHTIDSDPPAARWLQRRIGRIIMRSGRWILYTKWGTATVAAISAATIAILHKLTHFLGP
jgi:hypothetical protein